MNKEDMQEGRHFLKANWQEFEGRVSDQMKGLSQPEPQKPAGEAERINLPPLHETTAFAKKNVYDAIMERESRRRYSPGPISREELSFLLTSTQGVRRKMGQNHFRTVPSGGSRHPFETYIAAIDVEGLEEGLYRYLPFDHQLVSESTVDNFRGSINRAIFGQLFKNTAVVFFWTVIPYRTEWRYETVSHKVIALDAGHICQNLYLACEAISCGTCAIGAYDQEKVDTLLGVDGEDEFTIYLAPVGRAG